MADRGTWPKAGQLVVNGRVVGRIVSIAFSRPLLTPAIANVPCFWGAPSPSCVAAGDVAKQAPDRSFTERRQELQQIADDSRVLDSRLEKLCHEADLDPEPRRAALARGQTVAFIRKSRGRTICVMRIRPGDFD
jgi:hypothetical protein